MSKSLISRLLIFGTVFILTTNCAARSPHLYFSGGPTAVLMNEGRAQVGWAGRAMIGFEIGGTSPESNIEWLFEFHANSVPYPARVGYASLPPIDTTRKVYPSGEYGLHGLGGGVRFRLATVFDLPVHLQVTGGLNAQSKRIQQGDLIFEGPRLYLYPTLYFALGKSYFVSIGSLITSLDSPPVALFPVQLGIRLL